ncbi:histidine phosphatase family protein [Caballeronia sp. LZ062]|uniref:histidine phosphatase family protein n=1 Tax=Caballeronia sp. LZ062 TaxID=3038557 RepID=UPI00285B892C|nr:histidine phosphatase family protein [Caballeronia sp. LZ062]MDR5869092.1 histidine phosphatase family protein [Caballeronia sp. LZ062]
MPFYDDCGQSKATMLLLPHSLNAIFLCHAATHAMKAARFPTGDGLPARDDRAALKQRFESFDGRVITSPAAAARATAAWITETFAINDTFRDLDYGHWRGHSIRAVTERDGEGVAAWLSNPEARPHGGESIAMLRERVSTALSGLVRDNASEERCLIVTHAIVMKAVLTHVQQKPLESIFAMDFAPLSSISLDYDRTRRIWSAS